MLSMPKYMHHRSGVQVMIYLYSDRMPQVPLAPGDSTP